MPITGNVERIRRRIYESISTTAPSCGLRHAPEERQRPLHDAGDVAAPGRIAEEEAGRCIDDVFEGGLVDPGDRRLFLVDSLGVEPGRDLFFRGRTVGPAEPGLVAIGANGAVAGRAEAVGAGVPGVKHV